MGSLDRQDRQADAGTRTPDPHFTRVVLYQLSYVGADTDAIAVASGAAPSAAPSADSPGAPHSVASSASSDSPCFSQNAGPIPRIASSASASWGRRRRTSSSTALVATV